MKLSQTYSELKQICAFLPLKQCCHRNIEWFGLERTSIAVRFQALCHRQGCQLLDQVLDQIAPSPIQPSLKHLQGWVVFKASITTDGWPSHLVILTLSQQPYGGKKKIRVRKRLERRTGLVRESRSEKVLCLFRLL